MSNEWKKLEINDLPSDIAVNKDYVFEYRSRLDGEWVCDPDDIFLILRGMKIHGYEYRYRLRQPEPPTHEQLAEERIEFLQSVIETYQEITENAQELNRKLLDKLQEIQFPPEAE